jgi:hypothetical protein
MIQGCHHQPANLTSPRNYWRGISFGTPSFSILITVIGLLATSPQKFQCNLSESPNKGVSTCIRVSCTKQRVNSICYYLVVLIRRSMPSRLTAHGLLSVALFLPTSCHLPPKLSVVLIALGILSRGTQRILGWFPCTPPLELQSIDYSPPAVLDHHGRVSAVISHFVSKDSGYYSEE